MVRFEIARNLETFEAIATAGERLHAELGYDRLAGYNWTDVHDTVAQMAKRGRVFVAWEGDQLVGYLGLAFTPLYFNRERFVAEEVFWWVDDSYRGQGIGEELMTMAETEAQERGAAWISSNLSGESQIKPWLEQRGYVDAEHVMLRGL